MERMEVTKNIMRLEQWSWNDLPHDILCLIHNKKLYSTDRVRFRAVCRSWRIPKDHTKTEYPWLIRRHFQRPPLHDDGNYTYMFELIDPYNSMTTYKCSKSIDKSFIHMPYDHLVVTDLFASKYGWRLLHGNNGYEQHGLVLFFHNPFNNHLILMPTLLLPFSNKLWDNSGTFTTVPTSPDCEVLVLVKSRPNGALYIARYCLRDNDKKEKGLSTWTIQLLDDKPHCDCISVHYMDRKLYCFFSDTGMLKCYNLVDKSWNLITPTWSSNEDVCNQNWLYRFTICWLTETGSPSSLALASLIIEPGANTRNGISSWMVFKFDWLRMRWIDVGSCLKNITLFISYNVVYAEENERKDDDCMIIYKDVLWDPKIMNRSDVMYCYSFKNGRNIGIPEPYTWFNAKAPFGFKYSFIQPPLPTG